MQRPRNGIMYQGLSGQRLGRHVLAAMNQHATGVSTRSVARSYKEENWGDQVNSVRESVKRGLERVKLKNLHC
jgi:hypothetical protein